MPALNRFESLVGKMLMVHQSPKEPLGNFSHVLLDGRNFEGKQETSLFTEQATSTLWQKRDGINTYIDHEGGRVHRFDEREVSALPSAYAIHLNDNPRNAFTAGRLAGRQLAALGITMSLGPVVDIGPGAFPSRCFGTCAEDVFKYAKLYIEGLKQSVLVCLKHWPGHGAVSGDSHHLLPHTTDSIETLEKTHFAPFIALAKEVDAVMPAHIVVEDLDPLYPATFSKPLLSKLRENDFDGVILSDSMSMQGARELFNDNLTLQCKTAILAGCNLLILGHLSLEIASDIQRQLAQEATTDSELAQCIESSVNKIETMLARYKENTDHIDLTHVNKAVRVFGKSIARGAMQFRNTQTPYACKKVILLTPELLKSNSAYGFERAYKRPADALHTWKSISPTEEEIDQLSKLIEKDAGVIVVTFNADRESLQQQLVNRLFFRHPLQVRLLEVNYSDPGSLLPWAPENMPVVCTYSADSTSLKVALKALLNT